jgi:hypothetical protein
LVIAASFFFAIMPYLPGMDKPKFTPVKPNSSFADDIKSFNISDISIWGATTAVSFPIGYAIGKPVRRPFMWITGGLGCLCGFMLAYQRAAGRNAGYIR